MKNGTFLPQWFNDQMIQRFLIDKKFSSYIGFCLVSVFQRQVLKNNTVFFFRNHTDECKSYGVFTKCCKCTGMNTIHMIQVGAPVRQKYFYKTLAYFYDPEM